MPEVHAVKVRDLILRLQSLDPDLPVCLGDWIDHWDRPSEEEAEQISVVERRYADIGDSPDGVVGRIVLLGDDGEPEKSRPETAEREEGRDEQS